MKKLIVSVLGCGVVSLFMSVGSARAADANSYIQAHLGDGSKPYSSDSWSAPQGAQGPIRSDMSIARGLDPNDVIQANIGGGAKPRSSQMASTNVDTGSAPSGAQGPIRNDLMDNEKLFPLNAPGG